MEAIWTDNGYTQYLVKTDAGRTQYFKGSASDCVTRAITIATGIDYKEVYNAMFAGIRNLKENGSGRYVRNLRIKSTGSKGTTPRNGVNRKVYMEYLESLGWRWIPVMSIGSGCNVHLRGDEMPGGTLIVRVSKHLVTMIDGVIHDTHDCTRLGKRCVYGYFVKP